MLRNWFLLIGILTGGSLAFIELECKNLGVGVSQDLGNGISVSVGNITDIGLAPALPCAHDWKGDCHAPSFISTSSMSSFYCSFSMKNFIVSEQGGIFPSANGNAVTDKLVIFDYPELKKMEGYDAYLGDVTGPSRNYAGKNNPTSHEMVVSLRVKWDWVFNHLSFEVMPLIGAVYHFYKPLWDKLSFHCSMHSAAIMDLLGVDSSKIIIKETVLAKEVLFPATPHFHTDWILNRPPPFRGVAAEVSVKFTQALLTKKIDPSVAAQLQPLDVSCISHPSVSRETLLSSDKGFRYIVFLGRNGQKERQVYQQDDMLKMMSGVINKDRYRVVTVGLYKEPKAAPMALLQAIWQRFAQILSKAVIVIGPHGGAWNNLMFTPQDCHFIEFNPLPVERSMKDATLVRTCFLTGVFAKGGTGKYYNLEPTNGVESGLYNFYSQGMHAVSQRELLNILLLINKDVEKQDLLRANVTAEDAPVLSMDAVKGAVSRPHPVSAQPGRVNHPPPLRQQPQQTHKAVVHPPPIRQPVVTHTTNSQLSAKPSPVEHAVQAVLANHPPPSTPTRHSPVVVHNSAQGHVAHPTYNRGAVRTVQLRPGQH